MAERTTLVFWVDHRAKKKRGKIIESNSVSEKLLWQVFYILLESPMSEKPNTSVKLTHYKAIISKRGSNFVLLSELFLATKHVFHKVQSLQRIKCETGLI